MRNTIKAGDMVYWTVKDNKFSGIVMEVLPISTIEVALAGSWAERRRSYAKRAVRVKATEIQKIKRLINDTWIDVSTANEEDLTLNLLTQIAFSCAAKDGYDDIEEWLADNFYDHIFQTMLDGLNSAGYKITEK